MNLRNPEQLAFLAAEVNDVNKRRRLSGGRLSDADSLTLNEAANSLELAAAREKHLRSIVIAVVALLGDDLTDLIASVADERIKDHRLYDHGDG